MLRRLIRVRLKRQRVWPLLARPGPCLAWPMAIPDMAKWLYRAWLMTVPGMAKWLYRAWPLAVLGHAISHTGTRPMPAQGQYRYRTRTSTGPWPSTGPVPYPIPHHHTPYHGTPHTHARTPLTRCSPLARTHDDCWPVPDYRFRPDRRVRRLPVSARTCTSGIPNMAKLSGRLAKQQCNGPFSGVTGQWAV